MKRDRSAKIVATIGPASSTPEQIKALVLAGVDVFRLNFSHGTIEEQTARFNAIRQVEADLGVPISILQDLQGPKFRIGKFDGGEVMLTPGETVTMKLGETGTGIDDIPLPHPEIFDAITPGDKVLLDDGRRRLEVVNMTSDTLEAKVIYGGKLTNNKGVNLPNTTIPLSPLTPKDHEDLKVGLELGVDWIALSFVQRPGDILEARDIIGERAGILAKIEKPNALANIEEIVRLCDAIMVARGDLGVEIPPEEVPGRQKELVRTCRLAGKPVIIATQMLETMVSSPAPTRAEASDVATAIYDGADAVMLSAESAVGQYPIEAVSVMDRIIRKTESHKDYRSILNALEPVVEPTIQHAVSAAAADVASLIDAKVIVAFTSSGATAYRIARKRPTVPILAITPDESIVRRLVLTWGAHAIRTKDVESFREMIAQAAEHAVSQGYCRKGDRIVTVAGVPFGVAGSTNNLRVIEV